METLSNYGTWTRSARIENMISLISLRMYLQVGDDENVTACVLMAVLFPFPDVGSFQVSSYLKTLTASETCSSPAIHSQTAQNAN